MSTDVIPLLLILLCQQQDAFYLLSQGVAQVLCDEGSISQNFWHTIQYLLTLCSVCKWIGDVLRSWVKEAAKSPNLSFNIRYFGPFQTDFEDSFHKEKDAEIFVTVTSEIVFDYSCC